MHSSSYPCWSIIKRPDPSGRLTLPRHYGHFYSAYAEVKPPFDDWLLWNHSIKHRTIKAILRMVKYHLRCMGHPALYAPNGEPIRFRTKKHMALLVYLAVEAPRSHRRDRLAELLWPRAPIAEARHSLATALSVLRALIGADALTTTREHVSLDHNRLLLDLERLARRDILGTETAEPLDVASFLEGFDIPDAPEFAMWKDRQRARVLPMVKDALAFLIQRCRSSGDAHLVELLAEQMLSLDDLSEEAIMAKMETRAIFGDRLTALKFYEDWKSRLQTELGAAPSTSVEQMATRLRRGGFGAEVGDIPVLSPEVSRDRQFLGRSKEYKQLYDAWIKLRHGKGVHSLILGDSGVGKTTLIERFTTVATLEGATVSKVQSYDLERAIPFATLSGLIVGLLDKPGASATPPEALAELARITPEVRRRYTHLPMPEEAHGEASRIRLTEAFQQLIQGVAEEHPTILVVDDLHLADEPSLAVIHLLLRRTAGQRVSAVFSGRPAELGASVHSATLRDSILRLGGQEVLVPPLSQEQCLDLLRSLLQSAETRPNKVEETSLVRASGGLPMVLELLVQDWRQNGSGSIALALDAMTAEFVSVDTANAYGLVLSRLSRSLEPATRRALEFASILGHRLNDLPMYQVIDLSVSQTMASLGQLADMRVLRDGHDRLEFANELVRAEVYSTIPTPVRKALHASIADLLARRGGQESSLSSLELAWHIMRGGRLNDAIPHLLEGVREAIRYGAPQSAERALTSAVPILQGEDRTTAMFLLVEVLQEQGRWLDSLNICEILTSSPDEPRQHEAFALGALAKSYLGVSFSAELLQLLPTLRHIIRSCPHLPSRVRAARAVAQAIAPIRDRALGHELLALASDIPFVGLEPDAKGQLRLAKAMLYYQAGLTEQAFQEANDELMHLQSRGIANTLAVQLQSGLGVIRSLQGCYEEAAFHYERALRMAERLGNDSLAKRIGANLALAYGRLGRFDEQLACAEAAWNVPPCDPNPWRDIQLTYSAAFANALTGKAATARSAVATLDTQLRSDLDRSFMQRWLLWKADVLMASGARVEATEAAKRGVTAYDFQLTASAFAGPFARWVAIISRGTEREPTARKVLSELEANLVDFDAMDRLEILCAVAYIERFNGHNNQARIAEMLRALPSCTSSTLRLLGMTIDQCT